ncbi:EAL domain-containing protein [Massilia sp. LXY-6]|uniref:EAL domain-containing protein n=1 Tax=Massilia sp. LXY-6 TaxID=3379823 RepID=UPI003EE03963
MKAVKPHATGFPDHSAPGPGEAGAFTISACPEAHVALEWFEHAPGFVAFLAGPDLVFAHANDAYKRLVGREHLIGLPLHVALPGMAGQGVTGLIADVLARGERRVERARAVLVPGADGGSQLRYVDFVIEPVPSGDGEGIAGLLIQGSDVTLETISQRELQFSLTHDSLTRLPNYALFRDRLAHALQRAARAQGLLQLAAFDLDMFKRVNALLGRECGESILREVALRIQHVAGPEATLARESGDKFLLMFEGEQEADAAKRIQDVIEAVAEPFDHEGHAVYVTCCVGGATFPLSGQTADSLLLAADRALARAREAGAGMLRWDDTAPDGAELERLRLGFALREAMARGELQVHYQPQLDLVTGKPCTVEALVRWMKDGEKVPPATLISVADECGLIGELGDWVLRTACTQAVRWREIGFSSLRVAVNLSARQFSMRNLESSIVKALSDTGLPASCLVLELTESLLMENLDHAVESLFALRKRGVQLCLDDFGSGYSSLANLQRLPIDVLKIDRSFLQRVPEAEDASAIVDAIITMGHSLGMRVVAEAVEREAQCDFLSRNMCDEVQGYYVSGPVPADAMTEFLRAGVGLAPHLLRFNRTRPTLLLVDDEPSILSSLRRLLRNEGYRILTANSGSEGLKVLAENAVDVIVSDQRMPEMTGVDFLRNVRQLYPDTVRIVLSGFTELQTVTDAVNAGAIYKFLTKPWDDEQLRGHIQEAFLYGAMANENRLLTLQVRTANQQLAAVNHQLESVLAQQRNEIERGEISLDIVHEALSNVPVPVLASDDIGTIVLANRAALDLFSGHGPVLGCDVRQLFPGLPAELPEGTGFSFEHRLGDKRFPAELRPMGNGSHSRGWLIAVTGRELDTAEH